MKLTAYLNPFNLVRWAFWGKRLDEIIDFDEKRVELESFFARTEARVARKAARIARLHAQNATHNDHMGKARLMSDNLLVMMTQALGTPAPETVEPTTTHEAE